jgi:hypothetical protein
MLCDAFGEHSLSLTEVFLGHSRFKVGRMSIADERSGRPSTNKTTEDDEKFKTHPGRSSLNSP